MFLLLEKEAVCSFGFRPEGGRGWGGEEAGNSKGEVFILLAVWPLSHYVLKVKGE